MEGEQALVRHAITPPKFEAGWLHRERLVDALQASIPHKIITISAPAGYGKSTLLADFSSQSDLPVCWVRLTEADQDWMRLASVLAASLERVFPELDDRLTRYVAPGADPVRLARTFTAEMQDGIETPLVVILDNAHLVDWNPSTVAFIEELLEIPSEQVTLIICGRSTPRLPYAKLIGTGKLATFGPIELALNKQEVQDLANFKQGVELSEEDAQRIMDITRGWFMGVSLLLDEKTTDVDDIALRSTGDAHEYLIAEVLSGQPDELKTFMLESAVMPAMTAVGCDDVLQRSGSDRILRDLVHRGMFIMSGEDRPRTYEYHPQFRKVLLDVLEHQDPRRCKDLRTRAAAFLSEKGMVEHAVALHLETGNADQAASLAEKNARAMLQVGRVQTLQKWVDQFQQYQVKTPMVLCALALLLLRSGEAETAAKTIDDARRSITKRTNKTAKAYCECVTGVFFATTGQYRLAAEAAEKAASHIHARTPKWLRAMLLWLLAQCSSRELGEFKQAEGLLSEAAELLSEEMPSWMHVEVIDGLTTTLLAQGKIQAAYHTATKAHRILKQHSPATLSISAKLTVARMERRLGNMVEALRLQEEVIDAARHVGSAQRECEALIEKGGMLSDLGFHEDAEACLSEGYALAEKSGNHWQVRNAILNLVRDCSRQGDTKAAKSHLKSTVAAESRGFGAAAFLIEGAAASMRSKASASKEQLEHVLQQESLDAESFMLCEILLACASLKLKDEAAAIEALGEAFTKASLSGQMQKLTSELSFQPDLLKLVRTEFADTPTMLKVEDNLRSMRILAKELISKARSEETSPRELSLEALGKMSIRLGGDPLSGPKPRALHVLCYLVDRGHENRDVLLERFWPGHPPGKGVANLHADVYSLRRAIGKKAILLEGTTYRMSADVPIRFDVAEFEAAATQATRLSRADPRRFELQESAIESYRGDFLPGVSGDWVHARRERLETLYLDLLVDHSSEALLRGRPVEALKSLRKALEIDEMREDTNAYLMEALGRLGRKAELSVHYHRYVRTLTDELGIDPARIVREAYIRWTDDFTRKQEGE